MKEERREELEDYVISCILQKNDLINELYIDPIVFKNQLNFKMINFFKKHYAQYKTLDVALLCNCFADEEKKNEMFEYWHDHYNIVPAVSMFYQYQEALQEEYKNSELRKLIDKYRFDEEVGIEGLVEKIKEVEEKNLIINNNSNKMSPTEMLQLIRNDRKLIEFDRLKKLNEKLKIKRKTINVIAARPSEGKSALGLNLFCDLAKKYKCVYFNMEMTPEEVYERMLGIETGYKISEILKPISVYQNEIIEETAKIIYNMNYVIVNGSMNIKGLRNKIIKEQRDEHLIVFIDYVGYITTKSGQSDRERIGEVTRELNNITKDYNCTIFLIAQINRNGSETPTMQDLKDSGELEQTADTIILIHDENKDNTTPIKDIKFLVPKCRGGARNVAIPVRYNKESQRMSILE